MNTRTKLSAKGQVVIPKDVRDRLAWEPGTDLTVEETPSGLVLRRAVSPNSRTFEEVERSLRARFKWDGPRYTEHDWKDAVDEMMRNRTDL